MEVKCGGLVWRGRSVAWCVGEVGWPAVGMKRGGLVWG